MKQISPANWLIRLRGYISAPHELLHVAGYRLVGKPCQYHWGDSYVTPPKPLKLWEHLVGLLFPFIVLAGVSLTSIILSTFTYRSVVREGEIFWFVFWTIIALISGGYAGTAIGDLRQAYLLISGRPQDSWTPFDLFFWPVVDWEETRRNLRKGQ